MRKNLKPKPLLYPLPVLIIGTYDESGTPDAMNAAWGTICDMNQVAIFLSATHKTTKNILAKKEFTVSMADAKNVVEADYVGVVSANDVPNKLEKINWTPVMSEFVNAPTFKELPLTLECRLVSFDEETECVVGEVVNVSVDEKILNENGKIDLSKFKPISYDPSNHAYVTLGEKVGNAFSDGLKLK
ncbi:MAG: flavin reductase [Bacilli bacterium]|nr:flavin reductase [Bacilli bacterium]